MAGKLSKIAGALATLLLISNCGVSPDAQSPGFPLETGIPFSPTASLTPGMVFELPGHDPDLFQPIELTHNPPLIARSDETVMLVFDVVNTLSCAGSCSIRPSLFYSYGESGYFQTMPLSEELVNEMQSLIAMLPATDPMGGSLRYYAEFSIPEDGYTFRYPVAGTIDLFTSSVFISVDLPPEKPVQPGETVLNFDWGAGPEEVGQLT